MRDLFIRHLAQTSPAPLALEIVKAEGSYLWDKDGKVYLDMISGISVCNIGHRHPAVVDAIKKQADQYLHLLVYGELIQSPQVAYAALLAANLPAHLNSIYFTNSGTEATEGAMKLAKRATGRASMIAFEQSYHGSSQGALSIMGDEYWRNAFRPLIPGIKHLLYNDMSVIDQIDETMACVIMETVQAERGIYKPAKEWLQAIRKKCDETNTLLVFDEIQAGFGRTGTLWAFQQYGVEPDILLLGKALGAGMPLGAFIASQSVMQKLAADPVLGHITTFGGHPVSCAAGLAGLKVLLEEDYIVQVSAKSELLLSKLDHRLIVTVRTCGLLIAVEFKDAITCKQVVDECIKRGLLTDWFLFAPECLRIAPPLTINESEILEACRILNEACEVISLMANDL